MKTLALTAVALTALAQSAYAGTDTWTPRGPLQVPVTAMIVGSADDRALYAGTEGFGVFKSTDGGQEWTAVNDGLPAEARVWELAGDPSSSNTLYAAVTGGLFKSTNRAGSWEKVAGIGLSDQNLVPIITLAVAPVTAGTLYAGTSLGGPAKSTDGGDTWEFLDTDTDDRSNGISVSAIAVDPSAPEVVYAGTFVSGILYGRRPGHLFKSLDGGETWQMLEGGLPQIFITHALAIDPNRPETLYALTQSLPPPSMPESWGGGVYKSTDGGENWTAADNGLPSDIIALAIDPMNPATLYVGGGFGGVFRSHDGGNTWTELPRGFDDAVREFAVDRTTGTLYAATEGGVFTLEPGPLCHGDCDGSGAVTIDELLRLVAIALGHADVVACSIGDADRDGRIDITELVDTVTRVGDLCPQAAL